MKTFCKFFIFLFPSFLFAANTTQIGGSTIAGTCGASCTECLNPGTIQSTNITLGVGQRIDISSIVSNAGCSGTNQHFDSGENIDLIVGTSRIRLWTGNGSAFNALNTCYINGNNHPITVTIGTVNNSDVLTLPNRQDEVVTITYNVNSGTGCLTTLPIQLSSFEIIQNKYPILNWTTISELNNDYFTIERSSDGTSFTKIIQVKGNGITDAKNVYSYVDRSPFDGMNYYRLTQVDFDGTSNSYAIKSVFVPVHDIFIYPTIFTDQLKVELPISENSTLWSITNMVGRKIAQGIIKQGVLYDDINISALPSGAYVVTMRQDQRLVTFKVVKM